MTPPAAKRAYVHKMFARIAPRYDLMNRVMTVGQDQRWRKLLLQQANLPPQGRLLDIATGTGDIALAAPTQSPDLGHVVGADFTLPMLHIARRRASKKSPPLQRRLSWSGADTLNLPFAANTFDAVASGFLMRNVVNVPLALAEQRRVCKAGGRVLILDVPRPPDNLWGAIFRLYFYRVVPFLGGLLTGQPDAYHYLPASADAFLSPPELQAEMEQAGLHDVRYTRLMCNTVALHVGVK